MDYIRKLKEYEKKTISHSQLRLLFSLYSDEELFEVIQNLSDNNILAPIKSSKTNGNLRYPIFEKYKITIPENTYEAELDEIRALHPALLKSGYLQMKPTEYVKFREWIHKLDRYLFRSPGNGTPISRKERSFEIFDEEKVLDDLSLCALLDRLGLTKEVLRYYDTPEYAFANYIPEPSPCMTLLICENKDIWFNIRRLMFEDHVRTVFGVPIDGVVYGCGNKVSGDRSLTTYTEFIGANVEYLYWGDIDRAGLNIFLSTVRNNPDLQIRLFVPAYKEMLRLAQHRNIPDSKDGREFMEDYSPVYRAFDDVSSQWLEDSIKNNKLIPQEIISYAFLKERERLDNNV